MSTYYDRRGNQITMEQWAATFGDNTVIRTTVGVAEVSTVWLGINHQWGAGPPLIFETMVFGGNLNEECVRYSTESEALVGHAAMCARVQAS